MADSNFYTKDIIDLRGDSYLNPSWGGHERPLSAVTKIAVHHDAMVRPHDYDSVARYRQEAALHYTTLGPGLMYHWKIDNIGQLFWIRPHTTWLHAVGSADNETTINICLDGYFHPPYNQLPTREQYEALGAFLHKLCNEHPEFPAGYGDIYPHKFFAATNCCGSLFYNWVDEFRKTGGNVGIPTDAVYDWPALQPAPEPVPLPPPGPPPTPPPTPQPPPPPQITVEDINPAAYRAIVLTHLDGIESGKILKDFAPDSRFDFVKRARKGGNTWLLTQYAIDAKSQGKRELAGIPEKDLRLVEPGTDPIPPNPSPSPDPPPAPNPTPSKDHEEVIKRLKDLQGVVDDIRGIVQWIKDFLARIFR